ncbi:MAG: sugar transporter permease [Solirubrobacterales bacterium]|nr:sugar transporter permease [Solirubrobacterales bacterium]
MEHGHAAKRLGSPMGPTRPSFLSPRTLQRHALLIVLGILTVILSLSTPSFFTSQNILNLLDQVAVIGVVACGMTVVMIAGGFDLSVGAVVALSAVVIAIAAPAGGVVAIAAGIAAAAVVGLVNGGLISKARVNPFVVTLGMMTIIRGLSLVISDGHSVYDLPSWFGFLGASDVGPVSWGIISFVVVAVGTHVMLRHSRYGRTLYALGSNEEASWLAGINTGRAKTLAYVISAALAGFAGLILAGQISEASPIAGQGYELQAIAAVIIGGTRLGGGAGTIIGTVIGALMLGVIDNGLVLLGVAPYWQGVVQGSIIIAAVGLAAYEKRGGGA